MTDLAAWIRERGIDEVECVVPDMSATIRSVKPSLFKSPASAPIENQGV